MSDLKICFLANLLFSFHTYLRIRRVTWLRAATAMFMHAHFNRWHYYILEFFLLSLYCFSYCSSPNNWSTANISSHTHVWRVACRKTIVIYLQTGPKFSTYIEGQKRSYTSIKWPFFAYWTDLSSAPVYPNPYTSKPTLYFKPLSLYSV